MLKLFKIQLRLEREERATARLQGWHQRHQERRLEHTEVRQARLNRRRMHRAVEQPAARQFMLATDCQRTHEHREVEQPKARQIMLATDCQRTHECRAAEQPMARQARLERLARKTA